MSTRRDLLMTLPVLGAAWACLQPAVGPSTGAIAAAPEPVRVQLAVAQTRTPEPAGLTLRTGDARIRPAGLERADAEQPAAR